MVCLATASTQLSAVVDVEKGPGRTTVGTEPDPPYPRLSPVRVVILTRISLLTASKDNSP